MGYWLLKSEPDVFGIAHLKRKKKAVWDGVRNYQARNFLMEMEAGDLAFFYHSSTEVPGIVGLCKVLRTKVPDPTQFDPQSDYFDPKSTPQNPRWWTVEVGFEREFKGGLSLELLRQTFSPEGFRLVQKGNRLSVLPVAAGVAERILQMAG
jgi:predicted RNA-binding protein with PUA-like domain